MDVRKTRYAKSGNVHIAYQVVGDGPMDIVYAPGMLSHLDLQWEDRATARFYNRLAAIGRLILFDKRGTGLSDRDVGMPTLEERMDEIRSVMDAAGSERAALIGYSDGGVMSTLFSVTYPERTLALVLLCSLPHVSDLTPGWIQNFSEVVEREWGTGASVRAFAPSLATNERARDAVARFERACASPSGVLALLKITSNLDTRPLLPLVRVPALVIHRASDPVITADGARHMAENIPGARLWQQPGEHLIGTGDVDSLADEVEEFLTGVRPAPEPNRVLATVLFTDLVGSTRLAAELGDRAWRERLDQHDELCRHEVERHHGRYVKATGDGLLATFDGPARAIRCARAIVDGVRALGLEARAGLHTGEVELRGDDVGGIAVHIAARVMQPARPGDVFVSQAVPLLVAGSGIAFEERGEHELKGVPGRWHLFAVMRE